MYTVCAFNRGDFRLHNVIFVVFKITVTLLVAYFILYRPSGDYN